MEEEKSVGYPERALSLIRDMESIRDQAEAEETVAAADDEGGEEDNDNDWDGNIVNKIQEEGEEGVGGGSGRGDKVGSAKYGSYDGVDRESTPATGYPDVESYALVVESWSQRQRWNLGVRGGVGGRVGRGSGGGATRICPSSSRWVSLT